MLNDLLIWVALLVGLIFLVIDNRRGVGALTLAYFLILSLSHVPGVLAYLDPDTFQAQEESTKVGFDATLIGMAAFLVGAIAARIWPRRTTRVKAQQFSLSADIFRQLGRRLLIIGTVSYFVILPVSALVPSLTAVMSVMGTLLILGIFLQIYAAVNAKDSRKILLILGGLPLLPLSTLTTGGFIGFGTVWALSITSFLFVIARRRIWFYLAGPPIIFLGLSLFVTYFQTRDEIRGVVWNEGASIVQRLDKIAKLFTDFQFLDLSNNAHRDALDRRLNQNWVVGIGIMQHRENAVGLLYGATVPIWALIPRAIWPDKPAVGGGQDWVTEFTGIRFGEGISVGVGQVLEFYMNFGMPGILAGFAVLGFILMRLDQRIMCALATRNISQVIRWAMPGLALLSPLGNLVEILVAFVSAMVVSQLLVYSTLLGSPPARKLSGKMSGEPMRVNMRR